MLCVDNTGGLRRHMRLEPYKVKLQGSTEHGRKDLNIFKYEREILGF